MKRYKPPKEKLSGKMRALRIIFYVVMIIITLLFLLPFWGTITTSLKSSTDAMTTNALWFTSEVEIGVKNLPEGTSLADVVGYQETGKHQYFATLIEDTDNLPKKYFYDEINDLYYTDEVKIRSSADNISLSDLVYDEESGKYLTPDGVEVGVSRLPEGVALTDLYEYAEPGDYHYYANEVDIEDLPEGVKKSDCVEIDGKYYADEVTISNLPGNVSLADVTYDEETGKYYATTKISLDAYGKAFSMLKKSMLNSLIITIFGALGSCFLGSICAYAISKYRFKFDGVFFLLLSAAIYLPYQAILIPLMRTMTDVGLYDTHIGVILIHTIYGMPMCMSMFRGFYSEVPDALLKQAMIDGNGPWRIYGKIILPNTMIASVTVLVFQCTSIWNEMLFALTMTTEQVAEPATMALNKMVSSMAAEFNLQMAGSIWLTLPILILYLLMGKYLIRGYMAGAVTAS
ncbi:MAG: carbohydrate ABC transporter permease [Parasporobacterium sp.]|nr:carbohydrate ABC transporter permease [Parasporobacterium sp.]